MTWYAWAMVALFVLSSMANISAIGRKREPITPPIAMWTVVLNAALVWGVVSLAHS